MGVTHPMCYLKCVLTLCTPSLPPSQRPQSSHITKTVALATTLPLNKPRTCLAIMHSIDKEEFNFQGHCLKELFIYLVDEGQQGNTITVLYMRASQGPERSSVGWSLCTKAGGYPAQVTSRPHPSIGPVLETLLIYCPACQVLF